MGEDRKRGLILQHGDDGPAGLFGQWLDRHGIPYDLCEVWKEPLPADTGGYGWICSLGSEHTPGRDGAPEWVERELSYLSRAIEEDVPVLGLCFGGQALAAAAGAEIVRADPAEVGWLEIETAAPELIPRGPWLHFHYDQLTLPTGATELARSASGPAAFRIGPHLGVQFHPEATPSIIEPWADHDAEQLARLGIDRGDLAEQGRRAAPAAAAAAERMFDSWWKSLNEK